MKSEDCKTLGKETDTQELWPVKMATRIFEEYGDFIYAMIRYNVKNDSEVDDIFQQFFLSLVHRPIPQNIDNVKSYIYRAIVNDIFDVARRNKSYRVRILKYAQYQKPEFYDTDALNIAEKIEQTNKMLGIIEKHLPRHEGQAVIHRYYYGKNICEAAEEMGVSKRSLSRYLCTGLKKLKKLAKGMHPDG
jgi:RNA polymerase sigma factor (sigma-70 family)